MSASRPSTAPDFLLSRAHGSLRTQGATRTFDSLADADAALDSGEAELIVGAIPFDRSAPAALTVPERIIREDGPLEPHSYYRQGPGAQLHARIIRQDPEPEEHLARVQAAINTIDATRLQKVVLARAVDIEFDPPVDPRLVAARLIDNSYHRDGFIADLSPAGGRYVGRMLVGSSPEVLIKKQGSTVTAFPLAGSAPRQRDPIADREIALQLSASVKDLQEHAFVVNHLRQILTPICVELDIPPSPKLTKTNEMWHLATPITGRLRNPYRSALKLASLVHPTPAVCGTPTSVAEELIHTAESDRGFYAGAVGWCDASGDGEYMVAIRCAEISADGRFGRAWAGGGIVSSSNPEEELAETSAKLRTMLYSLGL